MKHFIYLKGDLCSDGYVRAAVYYEYEGRIVLTNVVYTPESYSYVAARRMVDSRLKPGTKLNPELWAECPEALGHPFTSVRLLGERLLITMDLPGVGEVTLEPRSQCRYDLVALHYYQQALANGEGINGFDYFVVDALNPSPVHSA